MRADFRQRGGLKCAAAWKLQCKSPLIPLLKPWTNVKALCPQHSNEYSDILRQAISQRWILLFPPFAFVITSSVSSAKALGFSVKGPVLKGGVSFQMTLFGVVSEGEPDAAAAEEESWLEHKTRMVSCHRYRLHGHRVSCEFPRARVNEWTCGLALCCPSWSVAEWGGCSRSCGGGEQMRLVRCEQRSGPTGADALADARCAQPTPARRQACNTRSCPPVWTAGPWSQVRFSNVHTAMWVSRGC